MISRYPASARGVSRYDWLDSRHTFSFGDYYAPDKKGVSALRVINEDRVAPAAGFDTHSHWNAEIISYILAGSAEHKDSMGNINRLAAGEFQIMTTGTGVTHSEYNASATDELHFLQIWIWPHTRGLEPAYEQNYFTRTSGRQLIASPDGRDGSLRINQDALLERIILEPDESMPIRTDERILFVHGVSGEARLADQAIAAGDGAALAQVATELVATTTTEMLLFSLPD